MSLKNALILGGSRFIGFYLTKELLHLGLSVTHFRRGKTPPPVPFSKEVETIWGDRDQPADLDRVFQKQYSAVFDLSGYRPSQVIPMIEKHRTRIQHYLFCSTSSVLRLPTLAPYDENSPAVDLGNPVAGGKREIEIFLLDQGRKLNWPVTVFRAQGVMGPYDGAQASAVFALLNKNKSIFIPGSLERSRINFLDVRDLAQGFILAAQSPISYGKIYNIANDEPVSLGEFIKFCGQVSGMAPLIETSKSFSIDEANYISNFGCWHPYNLVASNVRIKADLGMKFTPLRETLQSIWNWEKEKSQNKFIRLAVRLRNFLMLRFVKDSI